MTAFLNVDHTPFCPTGQDYWIYSMCVCLYVCVCVFVCLFSQWVLARSLLTDRKFLNQPFKHRLRECPRQHVVNDNTSLWQFPQCSLTAITMPASLFAHMDMSGTLTHIPKNTNTQAHTHTHTHTLATSPSYLHYSWTYIRKWFTACSGSLVLQMAYISEHKTGWPTSVPSGNGTHIVEFTHQLLICGMDPQAWHQSLYIVSRLGIWSRVMHLYFWICRKMYTPGYLLDKNGPYFIY